AVKEGGSADPNSNAHLRMIIEQARSINMPKQNIQKAMEKGLGKEAGGALESVTYEGFGPEKVAVVIECITDNKNRTGAEIRSFFERKGGGLTKPGAVIYLFKNRGLILIEKTVGSEEQILKLIDLGIEDVEESSNLIEVYTQPENLQLTKTKIRKAGFVIKEASLSLKPTVLIPITKEEIRKKILSFLDELDEFDEVQKIYCNADFVGL
ncbi:MAG TPA: YebC/PmpR family DNA-binding transcriptional regulator, partial [Candidatus Bathyarchaeia archaeon]|nr:YebC/PmpR family DNA-binding transcriptional regulator [Candidatus Bathyarchaeia archaeon]